MKNIYLVITPYFPGENDFRGVYVYDQVKSIERNGNMEIIVIKDVNFYKGEKAFYYYKDMKVNVFKSIELPSNILPGIFKQINYMRFKKFLTGKLNIDFSKIKYIHSHTIYSAFLGVPLGREIGALAFVQHHGRDVFHFNTGRILKGSLKKLNNRYCEREFSKILNQADLNIGVSKKVVDELLNTKRYTNKNNYVLYNGVDTNKIYKIKNLQKDKTKFIIGCIGNFWELKDQITLLKALNLLLNKKGIKNIKTIFIGDGIKLNECKEYVQNNHLAEYTEFRKTVQHEELNEFYNSLNLFVLPSYFEALGCVYMEALSAGIPVIGVTGQGIEEIINMYNLEHALINKGNYEELAEEILYHMNNPQEIPVDLNIDIFIGDFLKGISEIG